MKKKVRLSIVVVSFVAVVLTSGCLTFRVWKENKPGSIECAIFQCYSGQRLSSNEVATISRGMGNAYNGVYVRTIDRHGLGFPPWPISMDGWEEVIYEILPGPHTVRVGYSKDGLYSEDILLLRFTAQAAHTYFINCTTNTQSVTMPDSISFKFKSGFWSPYIEDRTTGTRLPCVPTVAPRGRRSVDE